MRLLILILLITSHYCYGQQMIPIASTLETKSVTLPIRSMKPIVVIKPDFISSRQGYVCRQEWKFEKKTGLPVRLRLGSLDYVNKLEGK